jgi:hypothetical protein
MSQSLRAAVYSRMLACAPLVALVDTDPVDHESPAMFAGRKSTAPTVDRCLTYRVPSDIPDKRFRGFPGAGTSGRIYDAVVEIEYWNRSVADSAPIEAAMAALDSLFDNRCFATDGGRVILSTRQIGECDHYDDKNNCWFGLFRYLFRVQST